MNRKSSVAGTDLRRTQHRSDDEALWDWNLRTDRLHFSPGWLALIGSPHDDIGNTPDEWFRRVHPDDLALLRRDLDSARRTPGEPIELQYRLRHDDGSYRWMQSRARVICDDRGQAVRLTGTQTDVTIEAVTDHATGLPNRVLLLERLTHALARARQQSGVQFALLLVDVGRPAGPVPSMGAGGDPLLNGAARRLESCLRTAAAMPDLRERDLVARLDGDRFAVLLEGVADLTHPKAVGDHILAELRGPLRIGGRDVRFSPSIGIALSATGYDAAEAVIRDAETARHRAQTLGGSHCVVFDAWALQAEQRASQLEADLDLAVERGELRLMYQPIVSLTDNRVAGFEALVRWHHPSLGVVSPGEFVPMAERTGSIVAIGRWTLEEACRQLAAWDVTAGGSTVWVSVNVSGAQLQHPTVVDDVEEILRRTAVDPRRLVLELTEGVAVHDLQMVAALLLKLRAHGVRVSIDDFGTGYSSLAYLRQLPVDGVKIDQSFVRRLPGDRGTATIVTSILTIARELGLSVVAEGVETDAQRQQLEQLQCASAQGYLFAKPLPADEALALLVEGRVQAGAARAVDGAPADEERPPAVAGRATRWRRPAMPAVGAALTLVICAGIGATFYRGDRVATSSDTAPRASADVSTPPQAGVTLAGPEPPVRPIDPLAATSPVHDTGPRTESFEVIHLHRLGECRGRLTISSEALAFVAHKETGRDAFSLKHGRFTSSHDGKTLTIKTAARTYRFETPASSAKGRRDQISTIAGVLARHPAPSPRPSAAKR